MFKAIYHLFAGKPFDFYSPYTLNETYQRLYDLSERDKRKIQIWQRPRYYLLIEFSHREANRYQFHADRDEDRNLRIMADGLVKADITGVHVSGEVRVGKFMLAFLTIWLAFWFGFWIPNSFFIGSPIMILLGFIMMGIFLTLCRRGQYAMYDRIYNLLGKSKKKYV